MIATSSFLIIHQLQCQFSLSRGAKFHYWSYSLPLRARTIGGPAARSPAWLIAGLTEFKGTRSCFGFARMRQIA